jgi:hypothetical protein
MKTKNKTNLTPSVVSTSAAPVPAGGFTLGLDLGDRSHYVCVLDATGQIIHEGPLLNERVALALLLAKYPAATVALEAGTHSPWISRYLTELGATVIVANPRKLHAITRHERKCDRRDAVMLARLARADVALLHPLQHGSAQAGLATAPPRGGRVNKMGPRHYFGRTRIQSWTAGHSESGWKRDPFPSCQKLSHRLNKLMCHEIIT